jgi:hypothetical protein
MELSGGIILREGCGAQMTYVHLMVHFNDVILFKKKTKFTQIIQLC